MNAAEFGLGKYPDRRVVGHSEARLVPGDCVVCNSQASGRSFHEEGPYKMVECVSCGHIYTFPRPPQAAVDERYRTSGNWISSSDSLLAAGADSRYSFLLTLLKRTVPPPAAILDVGCSIGKFLSMARGCGYDCYGVEPGTDAKFAARLLGADHVYREIYTQPVDRAIDIVSLLEVMEHVPDPRATVLTIASQLRPGGYFLASVPGQAFARLKIWPARRLGIKSFFTPLILGAGNHLHYFSLSGLRTLVQGAGFEVVACGAMPADYAYLATRYSPMLKKCWSFIARIGGLISMEPLSSNIWIICRKSTTPLETI